MTSDRTQSDGADGDDGSFDLPADDASEVLDGKPTLPGDTPKPLRRRFLKAMGATAVMGASAGCLGLFSDEPDQAAEDGGVDYADIDRFKLDWVPKQILKNLNVKMAFNEEQFFFQFNWEQPDRGGWLHDYIVYEDGEWKRYATPDPWVADGDHPHHRGFYEDRVTFLLDDGSVKGFDNFGGWMTVHMGTRSLPGAATAEEVESDPHFGDDGLGRNDIRKYLPQSREGEWWESTPWDAVRSQDELDQLKEDGVFVDLPMFRAHRSNPMEYGTDHHVLDYRHGDEGDNTFTSQDWDEESGPEYMFDPEIVEDGALDIERLREGDYRQDLFHSESDEWLGEYEPYYLHEDWMVEFDPEVAEREGAAVPRRPLQEPEGSAADWRARGVHDDDDGEWTVEMWRDLETDHPEDTKQLEAGEVYDWMPAIHHGYNARWHWVAYPYKMGLGAGTDADFQATQFSGDSPDWDEIDAYTIPLIYPGQVDWTWLVSDQHRGYMPTRNDELSIWDVHENPRRMAAMVLGKEIGEDRRR